VVDVHQGSHGGGFMRTVVVALALLACDHRSSAPVAPVNATTAAFRESVTAGAPVMSESPVANLLAPAVTFAAFATSSGDGWAVGIEMAQTVTRVVVLDEGSYGKPLSLPAKPNTNGGFDAAAHGIRVHGKVDGGTLKATIEATDRNTFAAGRAKPPSSFAVVFGGPGLRVDWRQSNENVTALLQRPAQPTRKLEGEVRGAVFALMERDERGNIIARLDGALLSERAAFARWTTHEVSEPVTLDSAGVGLYPAVLTLPNGAKIAPIEEYDTTGGCVTDSVFPRVSNLAAQGALNEEIDKQLRLHPSADSSCVPTESWDVATYEVTAHGRDWVSFEERIDGYRGGSHGGARSRCSIANLVDGTLVSLAEELPQYSLKKLETLVRATLLKRTSAKSVTDLGFVSDDLMIDASRPMCVRDDHGTLFLEIIYGNDEGMFRNPGPPRARVASASARGIFPPGTLGARIFH